MTNRVPTQNVTHVVQMNNTVTVPLVVVHHVLIYSVQLGAMTMTLIIWTVPQCAVMITLAILYIGNVQMAHVFLVQNLKWPRTMVLRQSQSHSCSIFTICDF